MHPHLSLGAERGVCLPEGNPLHEQRVPGAECSAASTTPHLGLESLSEQEQGMKWGLGLREQTAVHDDAPLGFEESLQNPFVSLLQREPTPATRAFEVSWYV